MLKELQDIGLSEKEARVYRASLELGKTTAEKLATAAKVNRSTTYVQIEALMKMGLMSTYEEGKKTYFVPESPAYLKKLLDTKRQEISAREQDLNALLPELTHLFEGAGERPVVRFYTGKEGVATMRDEILKAKNKQILVLHSFDALAAVFNQGERDEYSARRSAKGITARVIYNHQGGPFSGDLNSTDRRHVDEKKLKVTNDIVIFDDKVAIANLQGVLFGVLIENKQIADSMRSMFDFMWSSLGQGQKK